MNRTSMFGSAILAAAALVAAPLVAVAAAPGDNEITKRGACRSGTYEFEVEREHGGYEVKVDLDRLTPGSRWVVVLRHDGKRVTRVVRAADADGEIEVDRQLSNTRGADKFVFRAKPAGAKSGCRAAITMS